MEYHDLTTSENNMKTKTQMQYIVLGLFGIIIITLLFLFSNDSTTKNEGIKNNSIEGQVPGEFQ